MDATRCTGSQRQPSQFFQSQKEEQDVTLAGQVHAVHAPVDDAQQFEFGLWP